MLSDVIRAIDYSDCAEAALILFCVAFALMSYATLRLTRRATETFASIPLFDEVQDPRFDTRQDTRHE
jgi:cytochrome c oxidase cbb3-type subunit IV